MSTSCHKCEVYRGQVDTWHGKKEKEIENNIFIIFKKSRRTDVVVVPNHKSWHRLLYFHCSVCQVCPSLFIQAFVNIIQLTCSHSTLSAIDGDRLPVFFHSAKSVIAIASKSNPWLMRHSAQQSWRNLHHLLSPDQQNHLAFGTFRRSQTLNALKEPPSPSKKKLVIQGLSIPLPSHYQPECR